MNTISRIAWLLVILAAQNLGVLAAAEPQRTRRPHLFLTEEKVSGLISVDDLRAAIVRPGHTADLWQKLLSQAAHDKHAQVITPSNYQVPSRSESQRTTANPDYYVCQAAGQRILRNALACLVTGDTSYRDVALLQIESLFDTDEWPDWRDRAHREYPADLRTGMLGRDVAIAYDWMHAKLSPDARRMIVAGLDRCAVQPFWKSAEAGIWWINAHNNWTTCVVGGLGIVGMALAEDHPDAERLVEFSQPRMRNYLKHYGKSGEFNESVGYSAATRLPVTYFEALRYATLGKVNALNQWPFVETALWNAYTTLPPGRLMAFGDAFVDRPAEVAYFTPIAAASRNELLQWFYVNALGTTAEGAEDLPLWLLGFDASLEPRSPNEELPLGRFFPEHGAIFVSRTSWNQRSTPCVVYGKAGIEENHEHHDAGQLCIDGFGERLIVDLGSPSGYPTDFFGKNRCRYYNASYIGHNVVTIDGQEMDAPRGASAKILAMEFDDKRGGYWQLDLTSFYPTAKHVVRTVAHLSPGIVAVIDDVAMENSRPISLRWHTIDAAEPKADGSFFIRADRATAAGKVLSLNEQTVDISRGQHRYQSPFDTDRTGAKLQQRNESFVSVRTSAAASRILTLFAVMPTQETQAKWRVTAAGHAITTPTGTFEVTASQGHLKVADESTRRSWKIPLQNPEQ